MKRLFCFVVVLIFMISVVFADEDDSSFGIDTMLPDIDNVFVIPAGDMEAPYDFTSSDDSDSLDSESFDNLSDSDDYSSNLGSGGSNLYIVQSPTYSLSELGTAFYEALVRADSQDIDEFSIISDVSVSPLYNLDNGSTVIPSNSFRAVLQNVIGPYSPVIVQYQYTNGSNTQYLREIIPDYQWMISAAIFALVLYCVFRLWGSILCRR